MAPRPFQVLFRAPSPDPPNIYEVLQMVISRISDIYRAAANAAVNEPKRQALRFIEAREREREEKRHRSGEEEESSSEDEEPFVIPRWPVIRIEDAAQRAAEIDAMVAAYKERKAKRKKERKAAKKIAAEKNEAEKK
ncbi:hypothetical protein CPLU01_03332 [Colletotrichum plurivorum]|uniref:Uncharacterized protein n=1 Tax=Colletotrichum plurivorum TaxID=2175906 RepID=A0A8H6KTE2_9PEZI|nr:hypothetical protein CPLU01_03332 [Colletotrichum plurivorum]